MNRTAKMRVIYATSDLVMTFAGFLIFNIVRFYLLDIDQEFSNLGTYLVSGTVLLEEILIPPFGLLIFWLSGYYNRPLHRSRLRELATTIVSVLVIALCIYFGLLSNDMRLSLGANFRLMLLLFFVLLFFVYSGRLTCTMLQMRKYHKGKQSYNVVIAASHDMKGVQNVKRRLEESRALRGYKVVGIVTDGNTSNSEFNGIKVSPLSEINTLCKTHNVQEIVLATDRDTRQSEAMYLLNELIKASDIPTSRIPVKIFPGSLDYINCGIRLQDIFGEPMVDLTSANAADYTVNLKRALDVALSATALLLLSPIMLVVAIAVKRSSSGPVLYNQPRIGRHRKVFNIHKFRTMYVDAEAGGPQLTREGDQRITPIGRTLRKYRLDELPQFWNVLKGEMSLVGPRPERAFYMEQILAQAPWYALVHQVRPGITSWGMVQHGYASTVEEMIERSRYDLVYLSNMSLSVDFKIILYTIRTIVRGEGK